MLFTHSEWKERHHHAVNFMLVSENIRANIIEKIKRKNKKPNLSQEV